MFKNKKLSRIGLIFLALVLVAISCKPATVTPAPTQTPRIIDVVTFIKNYLNEKYERGDQVTVAGVVTEVEEFLPPGAKDYSFLVITVTLGPVYTARDGSEYVVVAQFPQMEYSLAKKLKEKFEALKDEEVVIGGAVYRLSSGYRTKIFLNDCVLKEAP